MNILKRVREATRYLQKFTNDFADKVNQRRTQDFGGGGNNWQLPPPPFPKANTYLYIQPAVLNCLKGVKGTVLISVVEPVQS